LPKRFGKRLGKRLRMSQIFRKICQPYGWQIFLQRKRFDKTFTANDYDKRIEQTMIAND
jgi:hypothetical protein